MAAEVSVSAGQAMITKKEEESSWNNHKTPAPLHLHGLNYDTADSGTTVLAIKTHQVGCEADGEETEYGYPITCGDSRAVLLFKKFVCPGINTRCVQFNDQLISPKQFVNMAGKATLKDWKRAIRLGGVMLRKMMDSGQLDFYQHESVCSNTCRSTKSDVLINSTRAPPGTSVIPGLSCLAPDPAGGRALPPTDDGCVGSVSISAETRTAGEEKESLEDQFGETEWTNGPQQPVNPTTSNRGSVRLKRAGTSDGVLSLWRSVGDCGLMGEVLSSLQTKLVTTLKEVELHSEKDNLQEADVLILHSLCETFGLLDSVKQAVELRRRQIEESKIHNSVYVLDELSEDRRKQSCYKSRSYKASSVKHLRPHRQSQTRRRSLDFLSAVKTSAATRPLSVNGLSPAAQLFNHLTAYSGQSHLIGGGKQHRGEQRGVKEEEDLSGWNRKTERRTGTGRSHQKGGGRHRGDQT